MPVDSPTVANAEVTSNNSSLSPNGVPARSTMVETVTNPIPMSATANA